MPGTVAESKATLANLLDAFNGESNAHARYVAFAAKADADGWRGVASLFRAAAFAEQTHAANHARVIRQLGGVAHCEIRQAEVRSTLGNLKVALGGELCEIETMYPGFLEEAAAFHNPAAIRTFSWALEAEKTHARLFSEAIALVEAGKMDSWASSSRDFYVCTVCGYTSETPQEHERCPVCNLSRDKFEVIR